MGDRPPESEGFRFVTATTVIAGGGVIRLRLNLIGFVKHSFHRFIGTSLPLKDSEIILSAVLR